MIDFEVDEKTGQITGKCWSFDSFDMNLYDMQELREKITAAEEAHIRGRLMAEALKAPETNIFIDEALGFIMKFLREQEEFLKRCCPEGKYSDLLDATEDQLHSGSDGSEAWQAGARTGMRLVLDPTRLYFAGLKEAK